MNTRRLTVGVIALLACVPLIDGAQPPAAKSTPTKEKSEVAKLMRRKLENAQKLLEGIALNEFDKIEKHAGELSEISKAAEWRVLKTADYELQSNEFRRLLQDMGKNAKSKNLDGATLNYVDMTLTCVKCHKHVRETKIAKLPADDAIGRWAAE